MSASFAKIGTYDGTDVKSADTFYCCLTHGNYSYIGSLGGIWIINNTDPTNMTLEVFSNLTIVTNVVGLAISDDGNTLYAAGINANSEAYSITLIDVTAKDTPTQISTLSLEDSAVPTAVFLRNNQSLLLLNSTTLVTLVIDAENTLYSGVFAADITTPGSPEWRLNPIQLDVKSTIKINAMAVQSSTILHLAINDQNAANIYTQSWDYTDQDNPVLRGGGETFAADVASQIAGFCVSQDGIEYVVFNVDSNPPTLLIIDASSPGVPTIITNAAITDGTTATQAIISNDFLVIVNNDNATNLVDVSNNENPSSVQTSTQGGGSGSFAYPYFYTTNIPTMGDVQFYSWLITAATAEGWYYGDNNIVYQSSE